MTTIKSGHIDTYEVDVELGRSTTSMPREGEVWLDLKLTEPNKVIHANVPTAELLAALNAEPKTVAEALRRKAADWERIAGNHIGALSRMTERAEAAEAKLTNANKRLMESERARNEASAAGWVKGREEWGVRIVSRVEGGYSDREAAEEDIPNWDIGVLATPHRHRLGGGMSTERDELAEIRRQNEQRKAPDQIGGVRAYFEVDFLLRLIDRLKSENSRLESDRAELEDFQNSIANRMPERYDGDEAQEAIIDRWLDDITNPREVTTAAELADLLECEIANDYCHHTVPVDESVPYGCPRCREMAEKLAAAIATLLHEPEGER